jgi:[ribosomal protein S5]-alanine N-acetyltransferase
LGKELGQSTVPGIIGILALHTRLEISAYSGDRKLDAIMIETDRLLIRPYTPADLEPRHLLMQQAFESADTPDDTRAWLDWTVRGYRELARLYQPPYGDYAVVLKASDAVIGSVGLVPCVVPWGALNSRPDTADKQYLNTTEMGLFWAVLPAHQRQGYALEAARALAGFAFHKLALRRLVAMTEYDNLPSQSVMQRLGMTLHRNPERDLFWFQVIGVLDHPAATTGQSSDLTPA